MTERTVTSSRTITRALPRRREHEVRSEMACWKQDEARNAWVNEPEKAEIVPFTLLLAHADKLNLHFGRGTVRTATAGFQQK